MSVNDKQVGGKHYQTGGLQHWDAVYEIFGGDYLIGNATKYLARLGKKGGPEKSLEDINKAIHYLEKKRDMMQAELKEKQEEAACVEEYKSRFHGGDFPFAELNRKAATINITTPKPPVQTLGELLRQRIREEGLEDAGDATSRYTNQG